MGLVIDEMRKALASALPQRAEQQLGPRGLHMLPHQSAPFYFEASLDRGYINNSIWLSSMVFCFFFYIYTFLSSPPQSPWGAGNDQGRPERTSLRRAWMEERSSWAGGCCAVHINPLASACLPLQLRVQPQRWKSASLHSAKSLPIGLSWDSG